MSQYILALDQGTTSSRAIVFDRQGHIAALSQHPLPQHFPQSGWVEHDPMEIWDTQRRAASDAVSGLPAGSVAGIGVTNQRETTILWDKTTGAPVYNAIVWQCRRTAELCEELKHQGLEERVRASTGLLIDAYFSGSKIRWILDHVPGLRQRAERGEILFGTVETWLIWQLTGVHVTDYSTASRTMLFDIHRLSRGPVPHDGGLPLVRHADTGDAPLRQMCRSLCGGPPLRVPYLHGVVLHPPRLGIVLAERILRQGQDMPLPVEYDGPRAGRPLIQRQNMVRHNAASFLF